MEAKKEEVRKPTEEENKEFDKADEQLSKVYKESRVQLRPKTFMKISDLDVDDAQWLKGFCDKYTDRKQFLGVKVMRTIVERIEPLVENILTQINDLNKRIEKVEDYIAKPQVEEKRKVELPVTQGGGRK